YWFRGAEFDILDEHGRIIPNSEFLCHGCINIYPRWHNRVFPDSTPCIRKEMCTTTQGLTKMMLPDGFAVPLASDEQLQFVLSSRNNTTNAPRRIAIRCTMYLVADKDLQKSPIALNFCDSQIGVLVGKSKGTNCADSCCMSTGEATPIHYVRT